MDGEIQVFPNNDAAEPLWRAIKASDGTLVAPGSAGTLKYDAQNSGNTGHHGHLHLSDSIVNRNGNAGDDSYTPGHSSGVFKALAVKNGLNVPAIAKLLGMAPLTGLGNDWIHARNYGERLPLAGGAFDNASGAGLFACNLRYARAHASLAVGARPA